MRAIVDIKESYEGDLFLDRVSGNIVTTGTNYFEAFTQIAGRILKVEPGDYPVFPSMGFRRSEFIGKPNTAEVGAQIATTVKDVLVENSVFYKPEIDVECFPTGPTSMAVKITPISIPDSENRQFITIFDTSDNMIKSMVL